jgi:hypothetical protein
MTPIQRRACRSLQHVAYGRARGHRVFGLVMARRAERRNWQRVELTPKQLRRVALLVRRYRRQITSPNLLFWAQRTLVELASEPAGLALDFGPEISL